MKRSGVIIINCIDIDFRFDQRFCNFGETFPGGTMQRSPTISIFFTEIFCNYLKPQNEKKLGESQKSFSRISNVYDDVSEKTIKTLDAHGKVSWLFFEHSESEKLFAENFSEKDAYGWTALHCAAWKSLPEVAKALIEAKVNVNAIDDYDSTALHYVARSYCSEVGRLLIDAGANVNAQNDDEQSPLYVAKVYNNVKFVQMLLETHRANRKKQQNKK
jgi:ankyrin repeat protein